MNKINFLFFQIFGVAYLLSYKLKRKYLRLNSNFQALPGS